jgi:hypothetical protein
MYSDGKPKAKIKRRMTPDALARVSLRRFLRTGKPCRELTEPSECPLVATTPLKLIRSDCVEVTPAFEIATLHEPIGKIDPIGESRAG